jgi:cobalamin-dependent methionine synthase I
MINSSKLNVLEAGLKRLQGCGLAGPVEEGDAEFNRKIQLIRRYGAKAVMKVAEDHSNQRFAVIAQC